jgi:ubiquinone/menaquinone biosynthesis C-methylase UbiE
MFAGMHDALASLPDGARVLDVPCGGGVAFRALAPGKPVRYVAVDLDADMLKRARRRAAQYQLEQIEFVEPDMRRLSVEAASCDLCLTYGGLHMIPDPEVALAETGRCLRPAVRIIGSTFLAGGPQRKRLLFTLGTRTGHPAPDGTAADLKRWLGDAGFTDATVSGDEGFVYFAGSKV